MSLDVGRVLVLVFGLCSRGFEGSDCSSAIRNNCCRFDSQGKLLFRISKFSITLAETWTAQIKRIESVKGQVITGIEFAANDIKEWFRSCLK